MFIYICAFYSYIQCQTYSRYITILDTDSHIASITFFVKFLAFCEFSNQKLLFEKFEELRTVTETIYKNSNIPHHIKKIAFATGSNIYAAD